MDNSGFLLLLVTYQRIIFVREKNSLSPFHIYIYFGLRKTLYTLDNPTKNEHRTHHNQTRALAESGSTSSFFPGHTVCSLWDLSSAQGLNSGPTEQ